MLKVAAVASLTCFVGAFVPGPRHGLHAHPTHALMAEPADRRHFFEAVSGAASALALMTTPSSAGAIVYLDPARYGDQELKVAAVAKCKTRVRETILQDPNLGPAFFKLTISDALSYDARSNTGGPDGSVLAAVTSGAGSEVKQLKKVASVLQESQRALSRTNALTFADLVAISGAEAIEAIGGPEMTVQLGRTDSTLAARGGAASGETTKTKLGGDGVLPIDWNNPEPRAVLAAFDRAGLTDRETASMLGVLLTLEKSDKTADNDLLESGKGKVKKLGQMGRALSDKELRGAAGFSYEAEGTEDPDVDKMVGDLDDFLIVDNFGTRDQKYGKKVKSGVDTKTFNKEFKELYSKYKADPKFTGDNWIEAALLGTPGMRTVVQRYAETNVLFLKDLGKSFDRMTQLGAVYTGGKYDALLSGREKEKLQRF